MLSMQKRKRILTALLAGAMLLSALCAGGCSLLLAGLPETPAQKAEKGEELTSAEIAALTPEQREKYGYTSEGGKTGGDGSGSEPLVMPEYPIRAPKGISVVYPDGRNREISYEYDLLNGKAVRSETELSMDAILTTEYRFDGQLLRESSGFLGSAAFEYKNDRLQSAAWLPAGGSPAEASFIRSGAGAIGGSDVIVDGESLHIGCETVAGLVSGIDLEWAGERIFFSYKTSGSRVDAYSVTLEKYGDIIWVADVSLGYGDGLLREKWITVRYERQPSEEMATVLPPEGTTTVRFAYADAPSYFAQAAPEMSFMDPELRFHLSYNGEWWLI